MIDKLTLSPSENINHDSACRLLQGRFSNYITTNSNHYNCVQVFYLGAPKRSPTLLSLSSEPRNSIAKYSKLELNPSHFESYASMMEVLGLLLDPGTSRVRRLDCAVDLPISVEEVYRHLVIPRKRSRTEYKEGKGLTGAYYGKQPELLCIYDKTHSGGNQEALTRIELRQFKKKIPISFLNELPSLLSHTPFSRIRFIDTKNPNDLSSRNQVKASVFREAALTLGAAGAARVLNNHHNFERYFKDVLTKDTEIPNLDQVFQNNLKHFFKEESSDIGKATIG